MRAVTRWAVTSTGVTLRVRRIGVRNWVCERMGADGDVVWSVDGKTKSAVQDRAGNALGETNLRWHRSGAAKGV